MRSLLIIFILLLSFPVCFGQAVFDQKEAERLYKESILEAKSSKAYFAEDKKCRKFLREKNYIQAEISCRAATLLVEKLPRSRSMERHSAYKALGVALLWRQKAKDAIPVLEKSLEVAKSHLGETNAETGEVYFFIGQANHLLGQIKSASEFYTKAEKTYHLAIKDIDAAELTHPYFRAVNNILQAHFILLENAEMKEEAVKVKIRLAEFKKEFAKYLEN